MENLNSEGKSVYSAEVSGNKSFYPHYVATRELIEKYSENRNILELAGGDLQSTKELASKGYKITNIDLAGPVLEASKDDNITVIKADLENGVPLGNVSDFDTIIALDILEHLSKESAVSLLEEMKAKHLETDFTIIASVPIISYKSIPTYMDILKILVRFKRPKTGLFDRTHKIFRSDKGWNKLFREAGYAVEEKYFTNCVSGITGNWKNVDLKSLPYINEQPQTSIAKILSILMFPFDSIKRRQLLLDLLRHRGLYVLKPRN